MARIVVVGSANVDFVVQTPHIPSPGETVLGRNFVMAMGGKGANQAVGAARLGGNVVFVARVGQDIFGNQCLDAYQAEGIAIDFITRDPDAATGVALIAVAASGENSITVASGANMQLRPEHVEAAAQVFEQADIVLLQLEIPLETVMAAARLAHRHQARVVLNPAPAQPLPSELLRLVHVITPNRIELAQLSSLPETDVQRLSDEQLAQTALGLGVANAVVTLGAQGALAVGSDGSERDAVPFAIRVAPFMVTPVDTTAAGDAFNAGLAVSLGQGHTLSQAARYANACGALATTRIGAQPSLPRASEVEGLISEPS
jgi:ribokinase